ncbi:uncharacterized protein LOC111277684 [Durio zibethinus]|uniref:Uncharacterized protein LOC111277684 n=1 Tax=Durio zibethinus TaxID=66656 RepID=A0A6P5WVY3_DURZI|nr:uncharacterized protein LOC111277684 [Durio zibethinus]
MEIAGQHQRLLLCSCGERVKPNSFYPLYSGFLSFMNIPNLFSSLNCRGETLSSISKMYGVSVYSIAAANEDIADIDLVFKGQLLKIPAPSLLDTQLDQAKNRLWHSSVH